MRIFTALLLLLSSGYALGQEIAWFPVKDGLYTTWGESLKPSSVLGEYPRPGMVRKDWMNLNGIWNFTILDKDSLKPKKYDRQILTPFSPETPLSGLKTAVTPDKKMWYRRHFFIPEHWSYRHILLHIGASDWETSVYINGQHAGTHRGGYDPIYLDITFFLKEKGRQEIEIEVWDPTDSHFQPRGKQSLNPKDTWHSAVSGIWQTVWIEPVMWASVESLDITPDIDNSAVHIKANTFQANEGDSIVFGVYEGKKLVGERKLPANETFTLKMENARLWSPDSPFLYDVALKLVRQGVAIDSIGSYFGMRKIEVSEDARGMKRIFLNNKPYYVNGLLDQGYWPEGLYTAPSDEALKYDIVKAKELGYNTLRKHVKIEPERWYYHCDKLGILVWQDVPNSDAYAEWTPPNGKDFSEIERDFASESQYKLEFQAVYRALKNHPSIVAWVPFSEGWGQFKTPEITQWIRTMDTTRLVSGPSGGNFFPVGHTRDFHHFPEPALTGQDKDRALMVGKFGGLGLVVKDHTASPEMHWSYQHTDSKKQLNEQYLAYVETLKLLIQEGLSASFYVQLSDVENEVTGVLSYDRKTVKFKSKKVRKAHEELQSVFEATTGQ